MRAPPAGESPEVTAYWVRVAAEVADARAALLAAVDGLQGATFEAVVEALAPRNVAVSATALPGSGWVTVSLVAHDGPGDWNVYADAGDVGAALRDALAAFRAAVVGTPPPSDAAR